MGIFTDEELKGLVEEGLGVREIARKFKVTPGAVSQRAQKLGIKMDAETVRLRRLRKGREDLPLIEELLLLKEKANGILDALGGAITGKDLDLDKVGIALKVMAEVRKQMTLYLAVAEKFLSHQAQLNFQKKVVSVIGRFSPDVQKEIIDELRRERALVAAVRFPGN